MIVHTVRADQVFDHESLIHLSIHLSIHPSVYPSIYSSIHLSIYLSIYQGIRNQLLTVCLQLTDTQPGDGGFCILPGSHKSNFPVPPTLADYDDVGTEYVVQPTPQAGDVLIFTEAGKLFTTYCYV